MMEQPSDDIIRRCQTQDAEAFCRVVELYERPLFGFMYRILWNTSLREEVEDVLQDVFLKIYSNVAEFRQERGTLFSTWVFSIARYHCLSLLRKHGGPAAVSVDSDEVSGIAGGYVGSREAASLAQLQQRVAQAVASLPEEMRTAFVLRWYEEMSYEEISGVMGGSVGTAKSRVSRARDKLAGQLKELV